MANNPSNHARTGDVNFPTRPNATNITSARLSILNKSRQHMPKRGSRKMKKLVRENSGSEVDLVNRSHVILEPHNVVENQPLSLADRVVADDLLLCWHLS